MNLRMVIALLGMALLIVFVIQNMEAVPLRFLTIEAHVSLALPILIAWVIGAFTVMPLLKLVTGRRKKKD
ncbi:MAG: hypothetical protein K8I27_04305 [Planctomycetes bacterium]|nr:hypothetical protein [Planctomycetota bacterium]